MSKIDPQSNDDYVSVHSSIHSMTETPRGTHCLVKAARMRAERQRRKEGAKSDSGASDSDEDEWDILNREGQVLRLVDPPEKMTQTSSNEVIDLENYVVHPEWDHGDTRAFSREARLRSLELPEHMVQINVDTYIQDLTKSFKEGSLNDFPSEPRFEDHGGVSKDQQGKPLWRRIWKQFKMDFKRQDMIIDDHKCETLQEVRDRLDHLSEKDYMNTIMLSQQGALAPPIELLINAFTTDEYSHDQLSKLEIVALGEMSDEDEKLIPKGSRISHKCSSRSRKMVVNIRTRGGQFSTVPLQDTTDSDSWGSWAKNSFVDPVTSLVDPVTSSISNYVPAPRFRRQAYRSKVVDKEGPECRVKSVMNPDMEKILPLPGASACVMLSKVLRVFDGEGNTQATVQMFLETLLDSDKGSQDVALTWREL